MKVKAQICNTRTTGSVLEVYVEVKFDTNNRSWRVIDRFKSDKFLVITKAVYDEFMDAVSEIDDENDIERAMIKRANKDLKSYGLPRIYLRTLPWQQGATTPSYRNTYAISRVCIARKGSWGLAIIYTIAIPQWASRCRATNTPPAYMLEKVCGEFEAKFCDYIDKMNDMLYRRIGTLHGIFRLRDDRKFAVIDGDISKLNEWWEHLMSGSAVSRIYATYWDAVLTDSERNDDLPKRQPDGFYDDLEGIYNSKATADGNLSLDARNIIVSITECCIKRYGLDPTQQLEKDQPYYLPVDDGDDSGVDFYKFARMTLTILRELSRTVKIAFSTENRTRNTLEFTSIDDVCKDLFQALEICDLLCEITWNEIPAENATSENKPEENPVNTMDDQFTLREFAVEAEKIRREVNKYCDPHGKIRWKDPVFIRHLQTFVDRYQTTYASAIRSVYRVYAPEGELELHSIVRRRNWKSLMDKRFSLTPSFRKIVRRGNPNYEGIYLSREIMEGIARLLRELYFITAEIPQNPGGNLDVLPLTNLGIDPEDIGGIYAKDDIRTGV